MTYKLVISGRLPGLNQYQLACRKNKFAGGSMKKKCVKDISVYIAQQLPNIHIDKKVKIDYVWYEPNMRRDLDNISSFGRKCIQDALVEFGTLKNDGWKNVVGFSDTFFCDKENPRIELTIVEVEDAI